MEIEKQKNIQLSQEKDYAVENVPIFSMKKDLDNINNPEYLASQRTFGKISDEAKKDRPDFSEKQKSSPFLNQSAATLPDKSLSAPIQKAEKKTNWQSLIVISIILFLVLAAGAAGYYYWITTQETKEAMIENNEQPLETEEKLTLSIGNPNYMPIDIDSADSSTIEKTIETYSLKVSDSRALTPVEFIITDSKNNPVNFEKFSSKLGLDFSQDFLSSLDTESGFSFFIYNDNEKSRLGLVIDSKDDYKLKNALFQDENSLAEKLEPLFHNIDYPEDYKFASTSYSNTEVRYANLNNQEGLSIDYSVFKNKLVIGTTKMTMFSIMDYISSHSEVKGAQDIVDDTNINNPAKSMAD